MGKEMNGFVHPCLRTGFLVIQRLGWLGHIERMPETRMVKPVHSWKPISKRPTGRPKTRWDDDVKKDIRWSLVSRI
jgi:hypothetical protein